MSRRYSVFNLFIILLLLAGGIARPWHAHVPTDTPSGVSVQLQVEGDSAPVGNHCPVCNLLHAPQILPPSAAGIVGAPALPLPIFSRTDFRPYQSGRRIASPRAPPSVG